ncbi:MAG: pantoate--beta-alanine ligase [Gammaproteobacteria bacterium]|nr:pantoate--beta-alanine ligase [Gammaproteobacteria bacterium]
MVSLNSPREAAAWCDRQRQAGLQLGFVPTMGGLHDGHLSLLEQSRAQCDVSCASIFLNPLQFNDPADLATYPGDFDQDLARLAQAGCAMVFTGTLAQFFPEVEEERDIPRLSPGPAGKGLEGRYRPGHLEGVVTIVDRLFRTVGPCHAYFGEKDFQQTLVVRDLAERLRPCGTRINVVVCPVIRGPSGLALSSRNQRLGVRQRATAAKIHQALQCARTAWRNDRVRTPEALESRMRAALAHPDIVIEYASIREETRWTEHRPAGKLSRPRALIAVYIDNIRLIDTLLL